MVFAALKNPAFLHRLVLCEVMDWYESEERAGNDVPAECLDMIHPNSYLTFASLLVLIYLLWALSPSFLYWTLIRSSSYRFGQLASMSASITRRPLAVDRYRHLLPVVITPMALISLTSSLCFLTFHLSRKLAVYLSNRPTHTHKPTICGKPSQNRSSRGVKPLLLSLPFFFSAVFHRRRLSGSQSWAQSCCHNLLDTQKEEKRGRNACERKIIHRQTKKET